MNGEDQSEKIPEVFAKTVHHFFPKVGKWVRQIQEPRKVNMIDYELPILFWEAFFLFLLQLGSSRNIDYAFGKKFLANFKALFPILGIQDYSLERMPEHGTLIDFLSKLFPTALERICIEMTRRLIRQRVLERYRLLNQYYLIAIDGTQTITISENQYKKNPDKYKHCLRRKISQDENGQNHYEYYYYVLEAKLVTPDGFAISVMTEFVENESQDVDRQDCELKAFYRLAQRLKGYFPRTKFCLLFDSLYAGKPVFDLIKKNGWIYIIRFKEGSIPTVYKEFQSLLSLSPENKGKHVIDANTSQEFRWVNDIEYEGHNLHILECQETTLGNKGEEKAFFIWICKPEITRTNYQHLANQGGRCRWKIENQGFKAQKKEGFELEHAYSQDYNAIKCFHLILQIAHTIRQLMVKGNLLKNIVKVFGSFKNFTREFLFAFTRQLIDGDNILKSLTQPYQIRIDSS